MGLVSTGLGCSLGKAQQQGRKRLRNATSFQKSFIGSDEVAGKFNPRKFNPFSNTRKSVITGPIRLNPGNVRVS